MTEWEQIMDRKRKMKHRLETDFEYRMSEVDKKLRLANAYAGDQRYVRYKTTVHDTYTNDEYEIGIYGECKLYNPGKDYA